jgi:peptidoglycan/LPS O-acetylase OafA/YrhL
MGFQPKRWQMRNIYIDWLRGVSIFLVLCTHGLVSSHLMFFLSKTSAATVAKNGYYGCTIFFVISGFLITTTSLKRWGSPGAIVPFEFYVVRVARILPLLVLMLSLYSCLYSFGVDGFVPKDSEILYRGIVAAITFQYNVFFQSNWETIGMLPMNPLWSLAIEEVFYLVFPLIMIALRRKSLLGLVFCILIFQGPAARQTSTLYSFFSCVDALAYGCLAGLVTSIFKDSISSRFSGYGLMLAGGAVAFATIGYAFVVDVASYGPSFVAFGACVFLVGATLSMPPMWTFARFYLLYRSPVIVLAPLALLGALSYEIYLFHLIFAFLFPPNKIHSFPMYSALALMSLTVMAAALNYCFSEPLNKRIRRFYDGDAVSLS